MGCGGSRDLGASPPTAAQKRASPPPSPRSLSGRLGKKKSSSSDLSQLEAHLPAVKAVAVGSLKALPPAIFLAAMFNDVAFFKALPIVQLQLEMVQLAQLAEMKKKMQSMKRSASQGGFSLGGGVSPVIQALSTTPGGSTPSALSSSSGGGAAAPGSTPALAPT